MQSSMTEVRPQQVLQGIIAGYFLSQCVSSAARAGLLGALARGPRDADELAAELDLNPDAVERVLRGCSTAGVVVEDAAGRFSLTPTGQYLDPAHPQSFHGMAVMLTDPGHWLSWGRLSDCLADGKAAVHAALGVEGIFDYYQQNPEEGARFSQAMTSLSGLACHVVSQVYDFTPFHRIVDIGGGHGMLLSTALRANPGAEGVLYDLPHVLAGADAELARHGVADRVRKESGDFFQAVPEGGDLYLLKHIIHDWDDEKSLAILRNLRRAMKPEGRVALVEVLLPDTPGPHPAWLWDVNMLVMTGGRERTVEQYRALLAAAGLELTRVVPTPEMFSVIEARPAV